VSVVGNLTILLSANVQGYTGPIRLAASGTKEYNQTAKNLEVSGRRLSGIFDSLRKAYIDQLPLSEQLNHEQEALFHLWKEGVIDGQAHGQLLEALDAKYTKLSQSTREYKEALREAEAIQKQINQIEQQSLTPDQRFEQELAQIQQLKEAGLSTQGQNFLFEKAFKQLKQDTGETQAAAQAVEELNQSIQRGTAAARPWQAEFERLQQLKKDLVAANNAGEISEEEYRRTLERTDLQIKRLIFDTEELAARRRRAQADAQRFAEEALTNDERFQREKQRIEDAINLGGLDPDLRDGRVEAARQRIFASEISRNKAAQDALNQSVQRGVDLADRTAAARREIAQRQQDINNAFEKGKVSRERAVQLLAEERENLIHLRTGKKTNKQLDAEAAALKRSLITPQQQLNIVFRQYARLLLSGRISQKQFNQALRNARREINRNTGALRGMVRQLGVVKTVAIGISSAALFSSIFTLGREPFEFESAIKRAIAVFKNAGDITEREALRIRRTALLSATLPTNRFNAVEASQALEELARDNVRASVAARSLPTVLAFATASNTDFREAVNLSSEVLKSFRLDSEDAEKQLATTVHTMNLLAKGAVLSSSDVVQLSQAMIKAGPGATELGLSIEDTLATVLALSEVGRKGFPGGNELRIYLRDLAKAFRQNEDVFEDFGIKVFDQDENFVGTVATIRSMTAALDKLSPRDRGDLIKELGFADKGAQFQTQLLGATEQLEKFGLELQDVDGFAEKLARDSLTETNKLLRVLRGNLVALGTYISSGIERLAGAFNKISASTFKIAVQGASALAAFTGVYVLIPKLLALIPRIISGITTIVKSLKSLQQAAVALQASVGGVKGLAKLVAGLVAAGLAAEASGSLFDSYIADLEELQQQADATEKVLAKLQEKQDLDLEAQKLADQFRKNTLTPLEQLAEKLDQIEGVASRMFDNKSLLDERTRIRAISAAVDDYAASLEAAQQTRLNAAADVLGSRGDFASVFTVRADDPENIQKRQLDQLIRNGAGFNALKTTIDRWLQEQREEEQEEFNLPAGI